MVLEIRCEKSVKHKRKFGPQGDPKIEPKSSRGLPKEGPGGAPEASRKGCRKSCDFRTPLDSENEAHSQAIAQFSLFEGIPKIVPKQSQNGARMVPKSVPRRSEGAPRALPEKSRKTTPKSELKGAKMDPKRHPKSSKKGVQKRGRSHEGPPRAHQGRF